MKNNSAKKENGLLSWLGTLISAAVLAFLIIHFVFFTTQVNGSSMNPTLTDSERLITLKFPLYYSDPARGDIVTFDPPVENNEGDYIKRVIGISGDTIEIIDGGVYLNGALLEEDYILEGTPTQIYNDSSWTVGENEFFVMGDNRLPGASLDSRYFGVITKDSIEGIAKFRYWPISDLGLIEN